MTEKNLNVVLGVYRSGSTSLAHSMAESYDSENHHEYFKLRWNKSQELNFEDHNIPDFADNDVVKIMGDILYFYPNLLKNLEKRYNVKYSMIYRKDFYSQLISFMKPEIATEKFGDLGFYGNVAYPETLLLDLEEYEDLLLDRAAGLLRSNIGLDNNFYKQERLYIYEEHYSADEKYNQLHKIIKPLTDNGKNKLIDLFNSTKLNNLKIELNIHD